MVLWSKQGASFWFTNLFSICCHFVLYLNAEGINEDTEGKKKQFWTFQFQQPNCMEVGVYKTSMSVLV